MNLRQLEMFLAVLDCGGFTSAARSLFVSQPALSQAIAALESDLGTPLFERVGRTVRPTAAGHALESPARQTMRDLSAARDAVRAVSSLEGGTLDLAALPTLAADPLPGLIGRFRTEHPSVRVRVSDPDDPTEVLAEVLDGRVEVAVTEHPSSRPSGIVVRPLGVQELVAILPPGSRPAFPSVGLDELAQRSVVVTPVGTSSRAAVDAAFASVGRTVNEGAAIGVETASREAVVPLVLAGAGAAFVPPAVARAAEALGARVATTRPRITRHLVLVHRDAPLAPAARRFVELALDDAESTKGADSGGWGRPMAST